MSAHLPPFQSLLDANGPDVWRYICARLGTAAAEDCYQETVLTALRAYRDLTSAENLRGWLFAVAHSRVVDTARAAGRRPTPVADVPEGAAEVTTEPPDAAVWREVRDLPDGQRDAIALRYGADLPYRDVAATLGCSEQAARQRVRAGLESLRTRMEVTQ